MTDPIFLLFVVFTVPAVEGVSDDAQFRSFIGKYYVGSANSSTVDRIMAAYPADQDLVHRHVHPSTPPFSTCSCRARPSIPPLYNARACMCSRSYILLNEYSLSRQPPVQASLCIPGGFGCWFREEDDARSRSKVQGAFVWRTCPPFALPVFG